MDVQKCLTEEIKKCRRKMNLAKLLDCGVWFAAAGGILGCFCELVSLVRQFYYVHLAAGLCFGAGLLAGIGYAVYKRADMKQAAGRLDSFGLQERMLTALELMEQESENEFVHLQRQDAFRHYQQLRERIRIPVLPDKKHILALVLSIALTVGLSLIPSPVRERAQLLHQVQEQAKEEQEKLEELLEALEEVDMESLTQEQRLRLQELAEMLQLSEEELAKADSWESLAAAAERLDYKYEQAGQSLESIASQLEDPAGAGIASAEALAKAAANQDGQQLASSGTPSVGSDNGGEGNGENPAADGTSQNGSGEGKDSGENGGSGEGNGQGEGSGQGTGSGQGEGEGSGSGNDTGDGMGENGRGTGSSSTAHDYVSIPNAISDDASLTGNKNGDQDSAYYRQQNGLAWEGEHVDYSSVIGEYTESAYEGIAGGKYPSGMESVIRDYFEKLNQ